MVELGREFGRVDRQQRLSAPDLTAAVDIHLADEPRDPGVQRHRLVRQELARQRARARERPRHDARDVDGAPLLG